MLLLDSPLVCNILASRCFSFSSPDDGPHFGTGTGRSEKKISCQFLFLFHLLKKFSRYLWFVNCNLFNFKIFVFVSSNWLKNYFLLLRACYGFPSSISGRRARNFSKSQSLRKYEEIWGNMKKNEENAPLYMDRGTWKILGPSQAYYLYVGGRALEIFPSPSPRAHT